MSDSPPARRTAVKETKAQKSERLKLAKNPWEAWDEVAQFAREGRDAVPAGVGRSTSSGGASTRRATASASPAARTAKARRPSTS